MKYFAGLLVIAFASGMTHGQFTSVAEVPAFHANPPTTAALPPVLTEKELANAGFTQPAQMASYKAVAKKAALMYQMPCYCYCDRNHGHTSLHSCFESTHGANCGTCMAEALYAYQQSKKGWTPKMIRDGIVRGDWKLVDLQNPAPVM
ncbi:MAG TPA: CYCXC family (seleno)protein [Candidatus Angelobacter sp.]|nr:CYCXC family (seleno)protein [Candidatus Angelobacter sp.]